MNAIIMKKITVRHYLNTKVKGKISDEGFVIYPIYVQIIYNKFSTDKRSISNVLTTEKGFRHLLETKTFLENETVRSSFLSSEETLFNEIIDIESSIKILEKWNLKIKRKNILEVIQCLSRPVDIVLEDQYRLNLSVRVGMGAENEYNYDTQYENFLMSFSGNIIDSIENIESYTKIDIKQFLKEETSIFLEALKLVEDLAYQRRKQNKNFFCGLSFAEFVFIDYRGFIKEKMKTKTIEHYDKIIKSLEEVIDDHIEHIYAMYAI